MLFAVDARKYIANPTKMIIIDPTMKSTPSTATALASNRRKLRLAGRNSPYVQNQEQHHPSQRVHHHQQHRIDAETNNNIGSSPSSSPQSSTLSPAARRRLIRAQPGARQYQSSHNHNPREARRRQPQHLEHTRYTYTEQPQTQEDQSLSQLNLHCTDSVDSDDNGTCFNSIGTTTPRHPPTSSSPRKHRDDSHQQQTHLHHDLRLNNNDNDKWNRRYDRTNGKLSPLAEVSPSPHDSKRFFSPKTKESVWEAPPSSRYNKGDNNSAYSEFEHWSVADTARDNQQHHNANTNQHKGVKQQRARGRSRTTRYERDREVSSVTSSAVGSSVMRTEHTPEDGYHNFTEQSPGATCGPMRDGVEGVGNPQDEVDEFLNRPNVKACLGVGAAATLCAAILGPVGLLVGVASAGIGMGVLQIPEEQRNNVCNHAATSLGKARDVALDLSDTVSTSCGKCANKENPAEAANEVKKEFIDRCCSGIEDKKRCDDDASLAWRDEGVPINGTNELIKPAGSSPMAALNHGVHNVKGLMMEDNIPSPSAKESNSLLSSEEDGMPRVACCRKGRVVPLGQIHSLRPSLQPRAWLDVMASAHTTREDKNEAMEEILILAKDKDISRWFLEEGILDSLMYILSSYFRNYSAFLRNEPPIMETQEPFQSFKPGGKAFFHARLAANCCVALGKAHCAAVHTEGDLLLMSAYSRGSVPIERQLAQMLFEVPHHMKVINPTQSSFSGGPSYDHAEFTLTELSMQQAEDLASSIKSLDDGNIDV